jgi:hypothetical protein
MALPLNTPQLREQLLQDFGGLWVNWQGFAFDQQRRPLASGNSTIKLGCEALIIPIPNTNKSRQPFKSALTKWLR